MWCFRGSEGNQENVQMCKFANVPIQNPQEKTCETF